MEDEYDPRRGGAPVAELIPLVKDAACEVVVCPPYVDLALVGKLLVGTNIKLGAQNIHWAPKGAFTGEISADMLLAMGVSHAIVGHSERRQYFGETDETVNKRGKVRAGSEHHAHHLRRREPSSSARAA